MFVVIVQAQVKPEFIEAFKNFTLNNARNSIHEPGIARFDFYQQSDDPTRFVLIEIYRSEDAPGKHRDTAHYAEWRDAVADMMVEPRKKQNYGILFPPISEW
jgi:autoinducer 2-degrading protein